VRLGPYPTKHSIIIKVATVIHILQKKSRVGEKEERGGEVDLLTGEKKPASGPSFW